MYKFLNQLIKNIFNNQNIEIFWNKSTLKEFDFSTSFALKNAKVLNLKVEEVLKQASEKLAKNDFVEKVSITKPGFINIKIYDDKLGEFLSQIKDIEVKSKKTVVIDFSSPNIAKKMHIGHLRSTVIGHSLALINKHFKQKVVTDSHIGDWGTQFGKLIVAYEKWLDQKKYQEDPLKELQRLYVKFHNEENENLLKEARSNLLKIQGKEPRVYKIWQEFTKISLQEYQKIYDRLEIGFDHQIGESFYNEMMPGVVKELVERKIAKKDDGAIVVFFDEKDNLPPAIIQKQDSSFLYLTSDLATIKYRQKEFKNDSALYVVDNRQKNHFHQLFKIAKMNQNNQDLKFIAFGIMSLENEKISTRDGNVINLEDLLDEGFKKARKIIEEKKPHLDEASKNKIANVISIGAIKYFDFMHQRNSSIIFSWEKAMNFKGNSSLYIQYTYSRITSLLKKVKNKIDQKNIIIKAGVEREIVIFLYDYVKILRKAWENSEPHYIANYLFKLASMFNTWYGQVRFLENKDESYFSRLYVVLRVKEVIEEGLSLLGIKVLDEI